MSEEEGFQNFLELSCFCCPSYPNKMPQPPRNSDSSWTVNGESWAACGQGGPTQGRRRHTHTSEPTWRKINGERLQPCQKLGLERSALRGQAPVHCLLYLTITSLLETEGLKWAHCPGVRAPTPSPRAPVLRPRQGPRAGADPWAEHPEVVLFPKPHLTSFIPLLGP